jgi:hypothetical protein
MTFIISVALLVLFLGGFLTMLTRFGAFDH